MDNSSEQGFVHHKGDPVAGRRVGSDAVEPRQREDAEPVADQPDLPRMDEPETRRTPGVSQDRLMDEHTPPAAADAGRGEMAAIPAELGVTRPPDGEYPPQQPRPGAPAAPGEPGGGYLRLQLRVDDGEVSVIGASRVAGPLRMPGPLQGGLAYEVTIGPRQLGAGDVPDPGVRRGFVPPDQPERGHSVIPMPSYEFTARFPADEVSTVNLPDLQVTVYRLDPGQAVSLTADRPLREHVGRVAQEVATLRGIRTERLPQEVRASLERALR
jgi:hypothetical protein